VYLVECTVTDPKRNTLIIGSIKSIFVVREQVLNGRNELAVPGSILSVVNGTRTPSLA
jgi:hypothetical protein